MTSRPKKTFHKCTFLYKGDEDRYFKEARKGGKSLFFARSMTENVCVVIELYISVLHRFSFFVGDMGTTDREGLRETTRRLRSIGKGTCG